jgi:hypothetical protein
MFKCFVPLIVLFVTIPGHPTSNSDSATADSHRQEKQLFFDPNLQVMLNPEPNPQVILYRRWFRPRPHFPAADRNDVAAPAKRPLNRPSNKPVFNPYPPNHHSHKHPDYESHIFGKNVIYYPDFPEFFADY